MAQRLFEFDTWRPGYGGKKVYVYIAGTSTLANLYTDEALSVAAPNPQTLQKLQSHDGTFYGKFLEPLYTAQSYFMSINGEVTGVERPEISSLDGEDASDATVRADGASYDLPLDVFAKQIVFAASFGSLVEGSGGVPATNTATINLAIAALSDGGEVVIPSGTYKINSLNIPENVIIKGQGRNATVLESVLGNISFTMTGARSGFKDICLDGVSLSSGSVGIKSVGEDELIFDHVVVKRFETGLDVLGGKGHVWNDFSIENTATGAKLHGDQDAGDTGEGGNFEDLIWSGGLVSVASTVGVSLSYEDALCQNINLFGVGFEDCPGTALSINGAQYITLAGTWFSGNTKNVNIIDDTDALTPTTSLNNDVISVNFINGRMNGGEFEVTGTCQNILLKNQKLEDVEFTLTTPIENYLILEDCQEDSDVEINGETTKLLRRTSYNDGASYGLTTSNTATKAWSIPLEPGQQVYLEGKVLAKGRNVEQRAIYHIGAGAYRPAAELAYDTQTANFTAGSLLVGATSGATARIIADSDSGTTGTLKLTDISGEFIDNEIITDDNGTPGSATANGTLSYSNATLDSVGNVNLRSVYETTAGYAAAFVANGPEIELRVTGATSHTVEWTVDVKVVTT